MTCKVMAKSLARKLILCELLPLNFKPKNNIINRKNFGCNKYLWKDTRKVNYIFWLRNWNNLITSSSSISFAWLLKNWKNFLATMEPRFMRSLLRREALRPTKKLCTTLRYFASGDSGDTRAADYWIGSVTISCIIDKTCLEILISFLQESYIAPSETPDRWKKVTDDYYWIWNFRNFICFNDGKHIKMQAAMRSGSLYFN